MTDLYVRAMDAMYQVSACQLRILLSHTSMQHCKCLAYSIRTPKRMQTASRQLQNGILPSSECACLRAVKCYIYVITDRQFLLQCRSAPPHCFWLRAAAS